MTQSCSNVLGRRGEDSVLFHLRTSTSTVFTNVTNEGAAIALKTNVPIGGLLEFRFETLTASTLAALMAPRCQSYYKACKKTILEKMRLWGVDPEKSKHHAQFTTRLVQYMKDVFDGKMAPASLDDIIQPTKLPADKLDAIKHVMKNDVKNTLSEVKEGKLVRTQDKLFDRYNFLKLRPPYIYHLSTKSYVPAHDIIMYGVKQEELDPFTRFVSFEVDDPASIPATKHRHKLAYMRSIVAISCSEAECLNCRTKSIMYNAKETGFCVLYCTNCGSVYEVLTEDSGSGTSMPKRLNLRSNGRSFEDYHALKTLLPNDAKFYEIFIELEPRDLQTHSRPLYWDEIDYVFPELRPANFRQREDNKFILNTLIYPTAARVGHWFDTVGFDFDGQALYETAKKDFSIDLNSVKRLNE